MRLTSLISLLAAFSLAPAVQAADLLDVYELALRNDPQIRIAKANYMAAQEASPQAWSQYLPQISGSYEISESDSSGSGEQVFGGVVFPLDSYTRTTDGSSWRLTLRQTVFNWQTIQQISAAEAQVAQALAEYKAAQQQLILRTSDAYFNLLAAKDTLAASEANVEALARQLEQTEKRYEVGLIAITDVQESQAAYDLAIADRIAAELGVTIAREALQVIIGQQVESLASPGDRLPLVQPEPANPEAWVERALEQNLNLIAARFNWEAAQENVDIQRAGHYPTLDFVASHSESDTDGQQSTNGASSPPYSNEGETDTIALTLSVPIFSGGFTSSKVDEAAARAVAARANLRSITLDTKQDVRTAYLGVLSEIARVKALRQAVKSARTALDATQAGYEVGTRTTVDVLNARQNLFTARTNYARAKYDYLLNRLRLQDAAGILAVEDIKLINSWLEKSENIEQPVINQQGDNK